MLRVIYRATMDDSEAVNELVKLGLLVPVIINYKAAARLHCAHTWGAHHAAERETLRIVEAALGEVTNG